MTIYPSVEIWYSKAVDAYYFMIIMNQIKSFKIETYPKIRLPHGDHESRLMLLPWTLRPPLPFLEFCMIGMILSLYRILCTDSCLDTYRLKNIQMRSILHVSPYSTWISAKFWISYESLTHSRMHYYYLRLIPMHGFKQFPISIAYQLGKMQPRWDRYCSKLVSGFLCIEIKIPLNILSHGPLSGIYWYLSRILKKKSFLESTQFLKY